MCFDKLMGQILYMYISIFFLFILYFFLFHLYFKNKQNIFVTLISFHMICFFFLHLYVCSHNRHTLSPRPLSTKKTQQIVASLPCVKSNQMANHHPSIVSSRA